MVEACNPPMEMFLHEEFINIPTLSVNAWPLEYVNIPAIFGSAISIID